MIGTNQFKNGMVIKLKDILYSIIKFQHINPGKGAAFVRTKLKNLKNGAVVDRNFRPDEKVENVYLEQKKLLFSYKSSHFYHFLDEKTYEETVIDDHLISNTKDFLKENMSVAALICEGKIVEIILPNFIDLKIAHTEPGFRGNTAQGGYKPARLETGLEIQVPLFINTNDTVRIDTRTGTYMGRV